MEATWSTSSKIESMHEFAISINKNSEIAPQATEKLAISLETRLSAPQASSVLRILAGFASPKSYLTVK